MTDNDQLRQLFDAAASGARPPRSEVNEITVSDDLSQPEACEFRRRLGESLDDVADLASSGARGPARMLGRRLTNELADQTAEPTPPESDTNDPTELAATVSRSDPAGNRPLQREGEDPRSLAARTRRGQPR